MYMGKCMHTNTHTNYSHKLIIIITNINIIIKQNKWSR